MKTAGKNLLLDCGKARIWRSPCGSKTCLRLPASMYCGLDRSAHDAQCLVLPQTANMTKAHDKCSFNFLISFSNSLFSLSCSSPSLSSVIFSVLLAFCVYHARSGLPTDETMVAVSTLWAVIGLDWVVFYVSTNTHVIWEFELSSKSMSQHQMKLTKLVTWKSFNDRPVRTVQGVVTLHKLFTDLSDCRPIVDSQSVWAEVVIVEHQRRLYTNKQHV